MQTTPNGGEGYLFPGTKPRIDVRDLAALVGVDPNQSRWTLWHRCYGTYAWERDPMRIPSLAEQMRPMVSERIARYGLLGVPARGPKPGKPHQGRTFPIEGRPDLVIPQAKTLGEGPGVGIVRCVEEDEWREEWSRRRDSVTVPKRARMECEGLLAILPVQWMVVAVAVGYGQNRRQRQEVRRMVMVRSDPDLRREMSQALWEFKQLLDSGTEPEPDAKGHHACLEALDRVAPGRQKEPVKIDDAAMAQYREELRETLQIDQEVRMAETRLRDLRERREQRAGTLAAKLGRAEGFQTGKLRIERRVCESPPIPMGEQRTEYIIRGGDGNEIGVLPMPS